MSDRDRAPLDKFASMRKLLDEIEAELGMQATREDKIRFSGLEVPDLIADIVDLLFPELKPYEAALYMYMFRHSIIVTGSPYLRVSRRGLRSSVVKSPYAEKSNASDGGASYRTIQTSLESLEALPAVRQEGEPTRDGTLYRILLPEEIPVCIARRPRTISLPTQKNPGQIDHYNVRENRLKIFERDGFVCSYCQKQLTRFTATLDHIRPLSDGGDHSAENLTTACLQCNSKKTSRSLSDFLARERRHSGG